MRKSPWFRFAVRLTGTLASLALAQEASANPSARIQVSNIKPLLIRAIDQMRQEPVADDPGLCPGNVFGLGGWLAHADTSCA